MSALISSQILHIASADGLWRAHISPTGASLVSLWYRQIEIVTSPHGEPLNAFAGTLLAPWPNRLEDGRWKLGNREFVAPINDIDGNNSNHGLVFAAEFDTVDHTDSVLQLKTGLFNESAFPFQMMVSITFALQNDGLQITVEVKNKSEIEAPVAFGLHPYFVTEADSELQLNARTFIHKNKRNLPTESVPIEFSTSAKAGLNRIESLTVDDCFTDLVADESGMSVTTIFRPSLGLSVDFQQSREFSHLMIFRFDETAQQRRTLLAVEPQTSAANALRNLESTTLLKTNQSLTATCQITLRTIA